MDTKEYQKHYLLAKKLASYAAVSLMYLLNQQLRTTGHPPILIARLVRESKKRKKDELTSE